MALLDVRDLKIAFYDTTPPTEVVKGISFSLEEGETLGIVGESGSGKTQTALSILHLLKENSAVSGGEILYEDSSVAHASSQDLQRIRGKEISMIFQDPMTSLNPTMTIGKQIMESLIIHRGMNKAEARKEAIRMLEMVKIPSPESRIDNYPHELSGGMRQRVMIAIALACNPKILIADEPTTALDVTIQAQIIDLMVELKHKIDAAIMLITHDMGVVAEMADNIMVMYAGQIVEYGTASQIFENPLHPYTRGLLASIPRLDRDSERLHAIDGTVPSLNELPEGCRFCVRCDCAMDVCKEKNPPVFESPEGQQVRCWKYCEKYREVTK